MADLQGQTDSIECLISLKEASEEHLSIEGGYGDGVVEDDGILALLDLQDILSRDLDEGLAEEDVAWIEFGVEAQSLVSYEETTCKDDLVTEAACVALYVLLSLLEGYFGHQKLLVLLHFICLLC